MDSVILIRARDDGANLIEIVKDGGVFILFYSIEVNEVSKLMLIFFAFNLITISHCYKVKRNKGYSNY